MTNRFDNLSLAQLIEREAEQRAEYDAIVEALKASMLAACPVKVGHVYTYLNVRDLKVEFLVCALRPDEYTFWRAGRREPRFYLGIHGFRATKKTTSGDGFGRRAHVIRDWTILDLSSERPGPRKEP